MAAGMTAAMIGMAVGTDEMTGTGMAGEEVEEAVVGAVESEFFLVLVFVI